MPDYPSVYPEGPVIPVGPGRVQARVARRRPRREGEEAPRGSAETPWRALLEEAVEELNGELRRTGRPYACTLHEDDAGFLLRVAHVDDEPSSRAETDHEEAVEELLEPADLPAWLARLRAGLGILLDREV